MISNFPKVSNFNWLFLKIDRFICNQWSILPVHCVDHTIELQRVSHTIHMPHDQGSEIMPRID